MCFRVAGLHYPWCICCEAKTADDIVISVGGRRSRMCCVALAFARLCGWIGKKSWGSIGQVAPPQWYVL